MSRAVCALAIGLSPLLAFAQASQKPAAQPPASLDGLWADYVRLDAGGDLEGSGAVLAALVRLRVERNIGGLEPMALALVTRGLEKVRTGERQRAETYFEGALGLDPLLPDAYLGYSQAQIRKGPLGILPALQQTLSAVTVGLKTAQGRYRALGLLIPALLLSLFATAAAVALGMLLRHGSQLRHDLEEGIGATRGLAVARGAFLLLLLAPLVTLQGYGWLPLWWLALFFLYLNLTERVVAVLLLLAALAAPLLVQELEARARTEENPLYRAAQAAVEAGPEASATGELERAARVNPDDRDLLYLIARQYRKDGKDEGAADVYREILRQDAKDPIALNNLANIEFYRGDFNAAIARYQQGTELGARPALAATLYYNLAQARLQKFEFQPATEARAQADRLAGDLTRSYESRWRYQKAGAAVSAVVDLSLSSEQLATKFGGRSEGIALQNVAQRNVSGLPSGRLASALVSRFLAFACLAVLAVLGLARWRGDRVVTLRCGKCGAPFSRRVTAQDTGELCTQCFHLFVVKDGVSPSAKNKKLMEVQAEEVRRRWTFRLLSLLLPGAGQVYGRQPIPGLLLLLVWFGALSLGALAGRLFSVTGASSALLGSWVLVPVGLLLLLVYVAANQFRPNFEPALPVVRRAPRRPTAGLPQ